MSFEAEGIHYLKLPALVELRLASGMSHPGRLKDLADVQELIKAIQLPRGFTEELHPYVQAKLIELWDQQLTGES